MTCSWSRFVVLPTTLLMLAAPAWGEKEKARQGRGESAELASAERGESPLEDDAERKAPARIDYRAAPTMDMDARADVLRDEAMAKLKNIIPTIADGPQKAELLFRLSEMYWTKSKFLNIQAMQTWDQKLQAWHEQGGKGEQPKLEEVAQLADSDLYKREAVKLNERILKEYPKYDRKDEVLYNLGSSLYESGKKKEGIAMYWTLIKQFKESKFLADAWLELGEHFFLANKLSEAIKAYTKAAELGHNSQGTQVHSYALYKLSWCDFNQQEFGAALTKLKQVVDEAEKMAAAGAGGGARDRIQLREEALRDMLRTYSHLDALDEAFEYYTQKVGDGAYRYLSKLAELYKKEGKHVLQIKAYEKLNTDYPYAPDAPMNQTAIMHAYAQLEKRDRVRGEVRRLVDLYSPNGVWAQKNQDKPRVLERAFEVVEQELAGLVTEQHRAAQETKLVETYKLARDIYKEYLDKFTDSMNSYRFRFFYAEILYELKQFAESAVEYALVAAADAQGEFLKPAAYTAVLSWEKVVSGIQEQLGEKIFEGKRGKEKGALEKLEKLETLQKGQQYAASELTETERHLADACDTFSRIAPGDAEVVKVKFKSARLYYVHNQFEEAATRFGEVIESWPKDDLARTGAELILQSFNVREDWTQLNSWARKFRDHRELASDKEFAKRVGELVQGASFNEIHFVFESKETPDQVAERFRAFVTEFPKSKFAMVALFNAMVHFDKANRLERSLETAKVILDDYATFEVSKKDLEDSQKEGAKLPEPELIRERAQFQAASFHERLAEFDTAARLYESYAKKYKAGPKRADALYNAGVFREGLGQWELAMESFRSYVTDFPKQPDIADVEWRIGGILERKKDFRAAEKHYVDYARVYGKTSPARKVCAGYKAAQAIEKDGRAAEARAAYLTLLTDFQKLPAEAKQDACALSAAAAAAFSRVEPEYEGYVALTLTGSEKQMQQNLVKKLELVDQLTKKYTEVLGVGQGDYGIAALYRIGFVYQHLAQALFATECPKKLTEDQCMQYQAILQEKAFPLEERAVEAYDKGLAKAYEFGLYNNWLTKIQDALKAYEPGRFPPIRQFELLASDRVSDVSEMVAEVIR